MYWGVVWDCFFIGAFFILSRYEKLFPSLPWVTGTDDISICLDDTSRVFTICACVCTLWSTEPCSWLFSCVFPFGIKCPFVAPVYERSGGDCVCVCLCALCVIVALCSLTSSLCSSFRSSRSGMCMAWLCSEMREVMARNSFLLLSDLWWEPDMILFDCESQVGGVAKVLLSTAAMFTDVSVLLRPL